jgi:8-oxo-dGTP pyrophosphatase MutT (NUDIX family)
VSDLHSDALATLGSWSAPDPDQEQLRRRYVAHLQAHPDGMQRSCRPDHLTASTLVLSADHRQVLLTLHAKAERWFQLGGHCEPDDHRLVDAATREAREESGLPGLVLDAVPLQLSEHEVPFCRPPAGTDPDGRVVHHLDVRFLAVVAADAVPAISKESLDVRWWPAGALPDPEPELLDLVRLARARVGVSPGTPGED